MLCFPQLESGAVSQYPITRRDRTRTVTNNPEDGGTIRMPDSGASSTAWTLSFSGLSSDEWKAIQTLFEAVQGRFAAFTFLDPTGNLLCWSEDFNKPVWSLGPMLETVAGVRDAAGGNSATRLTNTAQSG